MSTHDHFALALPKGVTSGFRPIKDGSAYDALIPRPNAKDTVIIEDGEVTDTVELMGKTVLKYLKDTERLAEELKGRNVKETCYKVWSFLYHHIQYRLDEPGLEQLRRPARSWADRREGIDCDCFSIFCSSLLLHLGIPHRFRIAKYDGGPWQHVYVVAGEGKTHWILDPVLSAFDFEKPYTDKKDFPMTLQGIDIAVLSGPSGALGSVEHIAFDEELMASLEGDLGATSSAPLDAMLRHLHKTRAAIASNPAMVAEVEDPEAFLKMLDYAIKYWNTDRREEALAVLADNERALNARYGVTADMAGELGAGGRGRAFFQRVGDFAKKVGRGVSNAARSTAQVVMPSGELMRMKFETIGLRGKFRELIGDPAVGFTAMVFGQPKSGKSTLMLEFAHHLAREHGEVLYCAIEEGYGYTLQEKIARLGTVHERLIFSDRVPSDLSAYDFVFIDSVSKAGMELEDLVKLKHANPRTSFVFIFHSTKQGQFRGGNELAHEVDVIIEVEPGVVKASGRFNAGGILENLSHE